MPTAARASPALEPSRYFVAGPSVTGLPLPTIPLLPRNAHTPGPNRQVCLSCSMVGAAEQLRWPLGTDAPARRLQVQVAQLYAPERERVPIAQLGPLHATTIDERAVAAAVVE